MAMLNVFSFDAFVDLPTGTTTTYAASVAERIIRHLNEIEQCNGATARIINSLDEGGLSLELMAIEIPYVGAGDTFGDFTARLQQFINDIFGEIQRNVAETLE